MPHVILEYSDNLKEKIDFSNLFADLHQILVVVTSADIGSCKSRAVEHTQFYIGNGSGRNAFIHVEVLLAEGRTLSVRQELGKQFLSALEDYFSKSIKDLQLQMTVEIKEFPRNLYFKIPKDSV